jgi:PKD repeat protein
LTNGSFEDAVQGNGVGQGWYSFSSSGYGPTYAVVSDPVYDGSAAQQVVSPQPSTSNQYAGVYQVVATESGSDYAVRAWNRTHFAGGSAWDHIARLGIDLSGGTDYQASSVEWYEFDSAKDTWHQLELNVTATSSAMTIFLQSWHKWASGGEAYTWFDHVAVATDDQPPPPPPNPGTPPGDNLALGASDWSAGSVYNGDFGGDKAYDGVISAGSKWTSDGSSPASWLVLDLGTNCDLSGFIVRHAGAAGEPAGYNTQSYRLESGSSLSGPWTTLATVDNSAQQNSSTTVLAGSVAARYVRLYIIDAGIDNYARIPEFEVYGSAGSPPPPPPGNNPPIARATANPTSGKAPLTVSFNATGSSDPDGDSLSYSWNFGDGTQGSGAIVSHTYQTQGIYPATLTVDDGRGGSDDVTATIAVSTTGPPLPSYCPSTLDFPAIRAQLNQQGEDLGFVKIGFHVGPGGNQNGLGEWMTCLDAAGVPFFLKSVDSAGQIWEAAQLKAASGVPHVLVYRRSTGSGWNWDVPDYNKTPFDAAVEHWQRQRQEFPPELEPYKDLIWIETINEIDKNRSEWLGEFAYHTAQMAMDQGFNWAAFGWSAGEPEREHWEGPWMQQFLELAGNNPDRVAVALHEYSYVQDNLDRFYPNLVGRFQMLFDVCDTAGIARPTVLVTEFGWVYDDIANSVQQAMEVDLPWAAGLYADFPQVLGTAIWYLGPGFGGIANQAQKLIAPLTAYALQEYFVVPLESTPPPSTGPKSITGGEPKGPFGSGEQSDEVTEPETWRWSERFYGHQGIDQITWQADSCGVQHNYAVGWHRNDLVEYLMKFGGNYSRLTLRGLADRPGPVELEIYIDGNLAATALWNNDNDCNQDTAVQIAGIPYGTHAVAVKFVNDYYDPEAGADRNFYLDGLRVAP